MGSLCCNVPVRPLYYWALLNHPKICQRKEGFYLFLIRASPIVVLQATRARLSRGK